MHRVDPASNVGNTVGKCFSRKGTGKGIFYIREHFSQRRTDMTANNALITGVLMNIQ